MRRSDVVSEPFPASDRARGCLLAGSGAVASYAARPNTFLAVSCAASLARTYAWFGSKPNRTNTRNSFACRPAAPGQHFAFHHASGLRKGSAEAANKQQWNQAIKQRCGVVRSCSYSCTVAVLFLLLSPVMFLSCRCPVSVAFSAAIFFQVP